MINKLIIGFISLVTFFSCDDRYLQVDSKVTVPNPAKRNGDTILRDSIRHFFYSRLTQANSQGLRSEYILPDEYKTKQIEIVFSGRVRTNYAQSNAYINVAAISYGGEMLNWQGVSLRYYITDINKWCYFKDSIHLKPETWHNPFYYINTFSFLGNSTNEQFDLDSLHVQIKMQE